MDTVIVPYTHFSVNDCYLGVGSVTNKAFLYIIIDFLGICQVIAFRLGLSNGPPIIQACNHMISEEVYYCLQRVFVL